MKSNFEMSVGSFKYDFLKENIVFFETLLESNLGSIYTKDDIIDFLVYPIPYNEEDYEESIPYKKYLKLLEGIDMFSDKLEGEGDILRFLYNLIECVDMEDSKRDSKINTLLGYVEYHKDKEKEVRDGHYRKN